MSLMRRLRKDQRGTSLILIVLSLTVLLGFAAIAIDAAGAWSLKRQDQSAADTGALAGAIFTAGKDSASAIADATTEVVRISYNTVDPDMSQAAWAAEWAGCTDPSKPVEFTRTGASDCISFTSNMQTMRVTTPIIPWDTTFGKVIGFNQIDTRANAEVHIELDIPGGVLPFGMPNVSSGNGEVCLKTGPNPNNVTPCDGPDEGNFGFLDFTQFGNTDLGTTQTCTGDVTDRMERNIAEGIDHGLGTWDTNPALGPVTPNLEVDACNDQNFSAFPYQVNTETGNMTGVLDDGFADGSSGLDGRLARDGGLNGRITVRGLSLDNTPLQRYLTSVGEGFCGVVATADPADHDTMATCLATWTSGDPILFGDALATAPRFGWVPQLWEDFGPGTTTMTIKDISAIYVQTTFWKCDATSCNLEWDPGETDPSLLPGPNNEKIEASTALNIPKGALPQLLQDASPGTQGQIEYFLSK